MILGYARVSTAGQNPAHQVHALLHAGVERRDVHADHASGAKAGRPRWDPLHTRDGLAAARARGRRPKLSTEQATLAQPLCDAGERTVRQIADLFGAPRSTVYGYLTRTPAGTPA
ncbi:hypothetical protein E1193_21630 [Micromonospora sp. KC606]|uniref:recombinase family protein n=1 Tax=Micromonospora sp. KC606 TaxID=2530379 RepID=UPI001049E451|nr:recombinase family protein [Micromonospora sp. KC606]TDC77891.1 hypothetical protein E1193_21630 [Micromonospora sp. KC606]